MDGFFEEAKLKHEDVKLEALALWGRLDDPAYDSPGDPEEGFPKPAIEMTKRGRRRAEESIACGSNRTRKSLRDFERSAQTHGDVGAEIGRLAEYPLAKKKYTSIAKRLMGRISF